MSRDLVHEFKVAKAGASALAVGSICALTTAVLLSFANLAMVARSNDGSLVSDNDNQAAQHSVLLSKDSRNAFLELFVATTGAASTGVVFALMASGYQTRQNSIRDEMSDVDRILAGIDRPQTPVY
jgi:hypothetical protein